MVFNIIAAILIIFTDLLYVSEICLILSSIELVFVCFSLIRSRPNNFIFRVSCFYNNKEELVCTFDKFIDIFNIFFCSNIFTYYGNNILINEALNDLSLMILILNSFELSYTIYGIYYNSLEKPLEEPLIGP